MKTINILFAIVLLGAATASAETRSLRVHGVGPRMGLTMDPDQFHFGGQLDLGDLAPNLMMMPNLEIAVGDNVTTTTPSFELDYRFRSDWGAWTPYLGGSIGPVFRSYGDGITTSDVGLYVQGGISERLSSSSPSRFFLEMKFGLIDAPEARFTVGWIFGS